ncbi:NAD-binding protein, partial [Vibrio cholerae O1]|nr:NAD-binding protein [Vibrio cholerae O1]
DLRGVVGNGIDPQVLAEAGAKDTDLLIACAALDETNLVCCKLAQVLFEIPTRIARVRSSGFGDDETLLGKEGFGVDRI